MTFEGAVIEEQGVTFAIAIVRPSIIGQPGQRDEAVLDFSDVFEGLPTILMAQDSRGTPTFYGRHDLVDFMANFPVELVPWQKFWLQ